MLKSWNYSHISQVRGGLFRPLHRTISKVSLFFLTPSVLSRWHVTAVVLQLILLPCSLRAFWIFFPWTPHMTKCLQKALCALWVTPTLFAHTLLRAQPLSLAIPLLSHVSQSLFHSPVFPLCNPLSNISSYSQAWAFYPSYPTCHYSFLCPWNPQVREMFILKVKVLTGWDLDGNRTCAN